MKRIVSTIGLTAVFAALTYAGPVLPMIQTLPSSGNVSGSAGTVVGWGFTLSYTGPDFVVLNDSFFTGSTVFGNYIDYLTLAGAPLYVAGPAPESSSVTQDWTPSATPPLGLGEFDLKSVVPPGPISGDIGVDYSIFSQDPNDPNFDPASFISAGTLDVAVQINVVGAPEPASILLIGAAILSFCLLRRVHQPGAPGRIT